MSNPISGGEKPTAAGTESGKPSLPVVKTAPAVKKEVKKFKMTTEMQEVKRDIQFKTEEGLDEFKIIGSGKAIGKKDAVIGKLRANEDLYEIRYLEGYAPSEIEQAIMSLEGLETLKKLQKKKIEMHFDDFKNHPHTELAVIQVQEKMGIGLEQYTPIIVGWVKKAAEIVHPKVARVAAAEAKVLVPEVTEPAEAPKVEPRVAEAEAPKVEPGMAEAETAPEKPKVTAPTLPQAQAEEKVTPKGNL